METKENILEELEAAKLKKQQYEHKCRLSLFTYLALSKDE